MITARLLTLNCVQPKTIKNEAKKGYTGVSDTPLYTSMATMEAGASDLVFRTSRDDFIDAVDWAAKSLPSKSTVPILNGVLLSGNASGLTTSAFDYDVSSVARANADVSSDGTVLVSGRLLSAIVKALPNKPVEFVSSGTRAELTCGSARFSLPQMYVEDYPQLPALPDETGTVAADDFREAIAQVAIAAGKDETSPMLTAVRVEIRGERLVLVATDRFRLAIKHLPWSPIADDIDDALLVPAKTLSDVANAGEQGSDIRLSLGERSAIGKTGLFGISGADRHSTSRLIDAEFPNYGRLLPDEHTAVATMRVAELLEPVRRVALVADRAAQLRLEFQPGSVRVSAASDELGQAEEELDIDYVGDPLTIAFTSQYLSDGLSALHTPRVEIGFTSPNKPAVLYPADDDTPARSGAAPYPAAATDYRYVLMPVRLNG